MNMKRPEFLITDLDDIEIDAFQKRLEILRDELKTASPVPTSRPEISLQTSDGASIRVQMTKRSDINTACLMRRSDHKMQEFEVLEPHEAMPEDINKLVDNWLQILGLPRSPESKLRLNKKPHPFASVADSAFILIAEKDPNFHLKNSHADIYPPSFYGHYHEEIFVNTLRHGGYKISQELTARLFADCLVSISLSKEGETYRFDDVDPQSHQYCGNLNPIERIRLINILKDFPDAIGRI